MFAKEVNGKLKRSRPVNADLFVDMNENAFLKLFSSVATATGTPTDPARTLYSAAMSYFAASDLLNEGDQKTPGTFFEVLIGHTVAAKLQSTPVRSTTTQTIEGPLTLPTDYIFDLGANKPRIHLPIKTSTRERAVQVWAHQRLLDGMHGADRFRGVLVCFAETNKQDNKSVVEVCVPQQWIAYQRTLPAYIAFTTSIRQQSILRSLATSRQCRFSVLHLSSKTLKRSRLFRRPSNAALQLPSRTPRNMSGSCVHAPA